jgi:hypothetical protein
MKMYQYGRGWRLASLAWPAGLAWRKLAASWHGLAWPAVAAWRSGGNNGHVAQCGSWRYVKKLESWRLNRRGSICHVAVACISMWKKKAE